MSASPDPMSRSFQIARTCEYVLLSVQCFYCSVLFPSTAEPVAAKEWEFPVGNLGVLALIFDPRLRDREQDSFAWH